MSSGLCVSDPEDWLGASLLERFNGERSFKVRQEAAAILVIAMMVCTAMPISPAAKPSAGGSRGQNRVLVARFKS